MNKNKIRIWNYCNYSSSNYGSSRAIQVGDLELYFSYDTIIAFRSPKGLRVHKNDWSTTTGKHLNAIDDGDKKNRLDTEQFDKELDELLQQYQLVKSEVVKN